MRLYFFRVSFSGFSASQFTGLNFAIVINQVLVKLSLKSSEILVELPMQFNWLEAADEVVSGVSAEHAKDGLAAANAVDALSCSDYAAAVIQHM